MELCNQIRVELAFGRDMTQAPDKAKPKKQCTAKLLWWLKDPWIKAGFANCLRCVMFLGKPALKAVQAV